MIPKIAVAGAAAIGFCTLAMEVEAQSVADFYKGRDLHIVVGADAGSGYDVYTRPLARHWARHIPGNPNIIVQNMPGANGIVMMNHLANIAPKDGTVVGSAFANNVTEPIIDGGKITKYDARKINWIGNIAPQFNGCFVRKDSAAKTLQDVTRIETLISATGANSNSAVMANVYNLLIGTKFKVISGYSSRESLLAIERKEVDGTCLSYDNVQASAPSFIERDMLNWLIVLSPTPVAALPTTPLAVSFAKTAEDRQIIELLTSRNVLGRPYAAPEGVPADRLAALRNSFMATMKDPAYIAEMEKLKLAMVPDDHVAMEKVINGAYGMPSEVVRKTAELTKTQ